MILPVGLEDTIFSVAIRRSRQTLSKRLDRGMCREAGGLGRPKSASYIACVILLRIVVRTTFGDAPSHIDSPTSTAGKWSTWFTAEERMTKGEFCHAWSAAPSSYEQRATRGDACAQKTSHRASAICHIGDIVRPKRSPPMSSSGLGKICQSLQIRASFTCMPSMICSESESCRNAVTSRAYSCVLV